MKRATLVLVMALACSRAMAGEITVKIINPIDVSRDAETIELNWKMLQAQVPGLDVHTVRVLDNTGTALLDQIADVDGDGEGDQLLFQVDIGPGKTVRLKVATAPEIAWANEDIRTHARFVPERKDDFAWENDLVAFRAYGPALEDGDENSGIDCFMKRVKYPILNRWYKFEKFGRSYHMDYGEGYDGYKVGYSLGAGGSAVWANDKLNMMEVFQKWQLLSRGPVRSIFTLSYGPRKIDGKEITEKRTISLDLHHRLFKVVDQFFVAGKPAKLEASVGVATHEGAAQVTPHRDKGYLTAWEKIDGYGLGTAVVIDPELIKDYKLIDSKEKYEGNAFFIVDTGDKGEFTYYAGYGWEKAKEINTPEQWDKYLQKFILCKKNPLQVTVE